MTADVDNIINQGLLFQCLNWGDSCCHPEIMGIGDGRETKKHCQDTCSLPSLDELKKLNNICKQCPKAFFEIHKKECPVCGSDKIVTGFVTGYGNSPLKTPHVLFPYYCVVCGKSLFSGVEL